MQETEVREWRNQNRHQIESELGDLLEKAQRKGSAKTRQGVLTGALVFCSWRRKLPSQIAAELKGSSEKNFVYKFLDDYARYLSSCRVCGEVAASVPIEEHKKKFKHEPEVLAPNSIKGYMGIAKKIIGHYDVPFSKEKFRDEVVLPRTHSITDDEAPRPAELRQILQQTDIRGKALISMLASSGMRVGELLSLRIKDIDFNLHPTSINIRPEVTKDRQGRWCFISDEATAFIKQWLGERIKNSSDYLFYSGYYSEKGVKERDSRTDTAMSYWTADGIFTNALKKAGLYKKDEHHRDVYHLHALRKFFFTAMLQPLGRDVAEALMGHKLFLDSSYRRYSKEQMGEFYLKGMDAVSVMAEPQRVDRVDLKLMKWEGMLDYAAISGDILWDSEAVRSVLAENDNFGEELSQSDWAEIFKTLVNGIHGEYWTDNPRVKRLLKKLVEVLGEESGSKQEDIDSFKHQLDQHHKPTSGNPENGHEKGAGIAGKSNQKVVDEGQLPKFLDEGWSVVTALPSGKIVVGL